MENLEAIFLTHGHEDHLGAIPYLWDRFDCPVYATPFTAAFLRRKLLDDGVEYGRVKVREVIPGGKSIKAGPFSVDYIHLTHSIPEPNALVIKTPLGTILHTGDYKFDPTPLIEDVADEAALKAVGDAGVLAMVGDSTNVFNPDCSGSEAECRQGLTEVIGKYDRRIAVTCFASNIARLESIAKAAAANGRRTALVGRSLWRMNDVARECGYLKSVPAFLTEEEGAHLPVGKVVFICTGSQGEPNAALARIAYDNHPHVAFGRGDVVIFSSRVIPGNEKAIIKVENQLARLGVDAVTAAHHLVHVSGHPGRKEVERMYSLIRPRIAVPIHGESMHLLEHAHIAEMCGVPEVVVNENGGLVRLAPGPAEIVDRIPTGRLAKDGERLVRLDSQLMRDRKRTVYQGAAMVTVVLDDKDRIDGPPLVSAPGILDDRDDRALLEVISEEVAEAIMRLKPKQRREDEEVREAARVAVRRALFAQVHRKPVVAAHLIRIE